MFILQAEYSDNNYNLGGIYMHNKIYTHKCKGSYNNITKDESSIDTVNKLNYRVSINADDFVDIRISDKRIENKKKAFRAFKDACSEISDSKEEQVDLIVSYSTIIRIMKNNGMYVPSFESDINTIYNEVTDKFIVFAEEMKYFVENNIGKENTNENLIFNNKFLNFCNVFKNKLVKYNCN